MKLKQITITVKDDATQEDIDKFVSVLPSLTILYGLNAVIVYLEDEVEPEEVEIVGHNEKGEQVVMHKVTREDIIRTDDQGRTKVIGKVHLGKVQHQLSLEETKADRLKKGRHV